MGIENDQRIKPDQRLIETWTVEFEVRGRPGKQVTHARLNWPHRTVYCLTGQGGSVEEARLDLVRRLGRAVAEDETPHGDERDALAHASSEEREP
jgi:hypothetical protein